MTYLDGYGEFCSSCFEEVGFTCGVCDQPTHNDELTHIAVVGDAGGEVKRGVYKILNFPFYSSDYFCAWVHSCSVKRDGHLLGDEPTNYPVALLCAACAKERGVTLSPEAMELKKASGT